MKLVCTALDMGHPTPYPHSHPTVINEDELKGCRQRQWCVPPVDPPTRQAAIVHASQSIHEDDVVCSLVACSTRILLLVPFLPSPCASHLRSGSPRIRPKAAPSHEGTGLHTGVCTVSPASMRHTAHLSCCPGQSLSLTARRLRFRKAAPVRLSW